MAKRTIASSADMLTPADTRAKVGCIKFISEFPEYHFQYRELDAAGKQVMHADANNNNQLPSFKQISFERVYGFRDPKTGKVDPDSARSFYICDPEKLGDDFGRVVEILEAKCPDPIHRMYTEDDHFKKRNPEAFRIAKEKEELTGTIEKQRAEIESLYQRLGLQKK
jgi:hypothetical protein